MSTSFRTCSAATRRAVLPSYSAFRPRCLNDASSAKAIVSGVATQLTVWLARRVCNRSNVSRDVLMGKKAAMRQSISQSNQALPPTTGSGSVACHAPRVKSGIGLLLPRSATDSALSGLMTDHAAAS